MSMSRAAARRRTCSPSSPICARPIPACRWHWPAFPSVRSSWPMFAATLAAQSVPIRHLVLAGTPYGTIKAHRSYDTPAVPADCLVVHGERVTSARNSAHCSTGRAQGLLVPGGGPLLDRQAAAAGTYRRRIPGSAGERDGNVTASQAPGRFPDAAWTISVDHRVATNDNASHFNTYYNAL